MKRHAYTYERAKQIEQRILAMADDGYNRRQIIKITGHSGDIVTRVLDGRGVFHRLDTTYLAHCPCINDAAAAEIRITGWPTDEARATREIYAACEVIRKHRPRDPVGYQVEMLGVARASLAPLDRRSRKGLTG